MKDDLISGEAPKKALKKETSLLTKHWGKAQLQIVALTADISPVTRQSGKAESIRYFQTA